MLASAEDAKAADIIVSCHDNWRDPQADQQDCADDGQAARGTLADALRLSTPQGRCVWDGVAFIRGQTPQPDWNIIFNSIDWPKLTERFVGSPNRTIFAVAEPPTKIHRPWHEAQGEGTIVMTCDATLVKNGGDGARRYIAEASLTQSWKVRRSYDFLKANIITDKPAKLSWICSAKALMRGHRYRLQFLEQLKQQVDFDHFGHGFHPIDDKWDALAPYRYSLAFENSRSDYYFTEKLTDCFVTETMPIYYGSEIITEFFPAESMVLIDPEDPDVFRIIKDVTDSDLWRKNRDAVLEAKRRVLDEHNMFARLAKFVKSAKDEPDERRPMKIRQIHLDYGQDIERRAYSD